MKVLHVIARLNRGGTSRWLETLTAEQRAAGQEVFVATGHVQGAEVEDPASTSLPLIRLHRLGRAVDPWDDFATFRELRELMGDLRPDVINTHTAKGGLLGRLAARSLGRRRPTLVHTVHGHLLTGYFSPLAVRLVARSERVMTSASDLILAVGARVRDELVSARLVEPGKVTVVWPGVHDFPRQCRREALDSMGLPHLGEGGLVAGWLGRLARVKRPDRLLGAAIATPGVDFIVGGGGELRSGIDERAPSNFRTLGWVDSATFWSACDLAVLTSDNEGVPTALVEAALAGLPAVTTNAGSASEVVVDGATGLVVPLSAEAVARGVRQLIGDPEARAAMGAAARQRALALFSPARMLAEHTAAYERAMALHRT